MKWLLSSQNVATSQFLVIGLGNLGREYENTRHNIGFKAVDVFARRHKMHFSYDKQMLSMTAQGEMKSEKLCIIKPQTYMNRSGQAVDLAVKKQQILPEKLLVIVDDIALDVGHVRFKPQGSCGGHNGLKSIEYHLKTNHFPRLRIGVGHPQGMNLADFVLSDFHQQEEESLLQVLNHVADLIEIWMLEGLQKAMTVANTKKS